MRKRTLKFHSLVFVMILSFLMVLTACSKDKTLETMSDASEEKAQTEKASSDVSGKMQVHFIDVGQADSILIENGENTMLIDAGNNGDADLVVNYLKNQGIEKLDYVIGTHPHEDHIGGLDAVINTFDIGKVYMPKVTHTSKTFQDVITAIKNKGLKISDPVVGSTLALGDAQGVILAPNGNEYEDFNNYSIVIKLDYGNTSFLFTGDAEGISEGEMINKGFDLSSDVLKVGHHGSHSSTTDAFLNKVNPKYAVIMTEKENDYGHPHKETMEKLKDKGIPIFRTDENGTIVAMSDGENIAFNVSPGDYGYGRESDDSKKDTEVESQGQKIDDTQEKEYVDENGKGLIKGNINSKGEKIYHLPDGAYYDKVNPENWFKTEREAQEAGFRKAGK